MRRGVLWSVLVAVAVIGPGCDSCKKKQAKAVATEAPEDDDQPDRDVPDPDDPPRPPRRPRDHVVRRNAPLTIDDAKTAMPSLGAARELVAPALSPNGAQVRFTYCVDAQTLGKAGDYLVTELQDAGWARVTGRPPTGTTDKARYGIAGEKADLRVSVTMMAVKREGCDSTANQFFTVASVNRIGPDAVPPPPDVPGPDPIPEPEPGDPVPEPPPDGI